MTNVILIPEKQISLIHPEWSMISMSFVTFISPDPFGMVSEKPPFTFFHKKILENINYYTEKRPRSPHQGRKPLKYTVYTATVHLTKGGSSDGLFQLPQFIKGRKRMEEEENASFLTEAR